VPLGLDNVVHENTGAVTTAGTSHVVSLAGTDSTTAGNTVLVFFKTNVSSPVLAGFVEDRNAGAVLFVLRKSDVVDGETSWTFTTGANDVSEWYVVELSNVDLVEPLDASVATTGPPGVANGGTMSTGTTLLNAGLHTVQFAAFAATKNSSTESWSGYTNGFEEVADLDSAGANLAVARKFVTGATGTFESTATLATSQGAAVTSYALLVAYRAADSPIVAPLAFHASFDWLTHGGMNSHSGITNMTGSALTQTSGTWGTNYLIQAASARNSAGGLRIVQAGAAGQVHIGNLGTRSGSFGFDTRVVSATGTVVVAEIGDQASSTTYVQVVYDSSATKFGVRAGTTGTVSWESGTTALNTWRWIDLRVKTTTTTWHVDWRIETGTDVYTDQAGADLAGQTAGLTIYCLAFGDNAAQTMTADFDNAIMSAYYVAYPLGPHNLKLLTVDPAGTPTVSGTTTNFSVFTANGTLAAWNAVNARNAVDEVPPTISAAADGVTQTAAAATNYIEFPMDTYTLAANETVVGVRMLAVLGSGTGAGAGDIAVRGWDGTAETALASVSQVTPGSATAISSTVPRWLTAMWQSVNGWTQAELDAAALRVGFSADATPDMWVHAVYLEIAVGKTQQARAIGDVLTAENNPNTQGIVSVTAQADPALGSTLQWVDPGGPGSQYVAAGGSFTRQFNAADASEVTLLEVDPDPDPDQPG
jgi:hypothetical protein